MIVINNLKKLIGLRIIVKLSLIIFLTTNLVLINSLNAQAIGSSQTPQSGSLGLVANIPSPSPSIIPTISTPSNGSTISSQQIQVSGLCQSGLLVKVYSNNIFVGSTNCSSGSYSLNIDLFNGQNSLTVTDFNTLGQNSPSSSLANINYSSPTATAGLDQLNLTSKITELGASPNQKLVWPIVISNGIAPYALSINWGDSSNPSVVSQPVSGLFNIVHSYSTAGIYNITISAGDSKGAGAFLQLVSVIGWLGCVRGFNLNS